MSSLDDTTAFMISFSLDGMTQKTLLEKQGGNIQIDFPSSVLSYLIYINPRLLEQCTLATG